MHELILATGNAGKLREFNHAFAPDHICFVGLHSLGPMPEIIEDGGTYEENALIKARVIANATGRTTVADDSGIEIDAIPGQLGVHSARWGEGRPYHEVNETVLRLVEGSPLGRGCRYVAAVAMVDPLTGREVVVRGVCEGTIHHRQAGSGGFGFDPIFYLPEYGKTMAEIPLDIKNRISHRAKGVAALRVVMAEKAKEA